LVVRAVAAIPRVRPSTPFRIAAEVNQRFRAELKKPIDVRQASTTLRRLQAEGVVRLAQKGALHHEAQPEEVPAASPQWPSLACAHRNGLKGSSGGEAPPLSSAPRLYPIPASLSRSRPPCAELNTLSQS
jgi:hypothetical protein